MILIETVPPPLGAVPTSFGAQKCGMVMSVTTQIIFPYMSDAHAPAMDIRMSPQDTAMALSFWQNLRSILIEADGYIEIPCLHTLQVTRSRRVGIIL